MIVAIIDDGVSKHIIKNLLFSIQVDDSGLINIYTGYTDKLSHGSICATIIQKYAPDAQIGSIKILDSETKRGDCIKLERAINWCIKNNDIKIIHLSLGTVSVYDYISLLKTINKAYMHGIIIISACKNGSLTSYPASFSNVIGVQCDSTLKNDTYYARNPNYHGIDFSASSSHEIKALMATPYQGATPICNSYATPVITAKVYSILADRPYMTFDLIKEELNKSSKIYISSYNPMIYKSIDWICNVNMLVLGDSPFSQTNIHYWNIKEIIQLDSDSDLQIMASSFLKNLPIAIYNSSQSTDFNKFIPVKTHPLVFLNKVNILNSEYLVNRIFVPTLIEDYATNQLFHNERPVVAILQDNISSDLPLSGILRELFAQKDYYALLFSEYPIDTLNGAVYIDNIKFYQYHCLNMAKLLNVDLILVHTTMKNLHILKPDVILCDKIYANSIQKKTEGNNTPVVFINSYKQIELLQIICDIICE